MHVRHEYRGVVPVAMIATLCCLAVFAEAAEPIAASLEIAAGPCLQAPSQTGVTVFWTTNRRCVSKVEYGTAPDGQATTAVSVHHGLIDANTVLHCIRLTGLRPGTRYYYRAVSTEIVDFQPNKVVYGETIQSRDEQFTTLDGGKDRFSFVMLNDRHDKVGPLTEALRAIRWDVVDLVFLNGDMIDDVVSEEQILGVVIRPCTSVFAGRIPFVLVRGNHEARGSFARMLPRYFPSDSGRYYFSFSHGGIRFVILDTGESRVDSDPENSGLVRFEPYLEIQTNWLREEIGSEAFAKARFRVVLAHVPPQNSANARLARPKYFWDHWVPLFNQGGIDLLLCGHTHRYAEIQPAEGKNNFPILIGGTDTIVRVDATADRLSVSALNNDGSPKSKLPPILRRAGVEQASAAASAGPG